MQGQLAPLQVESHIPGVCANGGENAVFCWVWDTQGFCPDSPLPGLPPPGSHIHPAVGLLNPASGSG